MSRRCGSSNPTPTPLNSVARARGLFVERRACLYLRAAARHAPLGLSCHATGSCHLGTTSALRKLERFRWWIGVDIGIWWWLCNCLKCQARKSSRLTVTSRLAVFGPSSRCLSRRSRHYRQRRLLRAPSGYASRKHLQHLY